ncbi:MAG: cell filamentation protein Fic [Bacteroidetes bacterium GWF2_38_335]|nr:MAG: cell filamentation protein Fic [Bacteroidetes bacterium GWF2_38_335]OFY80089.1 MAG: cell filamentation protein Fic [Bacteroidetes bacterium RIFOXYA12_FULL_38_20]HBS88587.1 mobile mystery protein B [Bacteroidales bacterium]
MGLKIEYIEGQTPIDEDEKEGLLIKSITTRGELDEFEQFNIEKAIQLTFGKKWNPEYILSEHFVRELHKKMFSDVWEWAGEFRKTNKNIGVEKYQIAICLRQLLDDSLFWLKNKTYTDDEFAIRFKHRIVTIHCFPNGNGRHSRLIADIIISQIFGKPVFSWNRYDLNKRGVARTNYLTAVRQADKGEINSLIVFART